MMISDLYIKDTQYSFKILPLFLSFGIHTEGFCSLFCLEIITDGLHVALEIVTFKKLA